MPLKRPDNKGLEGQATLFIDRTRSLRLSCGWVISLAFIIILSFGSIAHRVERSSHHHYLQEVRSVVFQEAALIGSRLEAEVNSSFFLIAGLASYTGMKREITLEESAEICARMFDSIPGLVNIAAAPNLVN